jgi:hypothetical protein
MTDEKYTWKIFEGKMKRTIFLPDGHIVDGKRTYTNTTDINPAAELIGATIVSAFPNAQTFFAVLSEKKYCIECNDNDGMVITSIEIDWKQDGEN